MMNLIYNRRMIVTGRGKTLSAFLPCPGKK